MADIGIFAAIGLTGGTLGSLDAINGNLLDGNSVALVITPNNVYFYQLDATSGLLESSPDIIAPDDNPGDKRWIRVKTYASVESHPESGEHRLKGLRLDSTNRIIVTYDSVAEP